MNQELLERMSQISGEEEHILQGNAIDMKLYGSERSQAVKADRLLGRDRHIDIRRHTRFAAFPRHRHDFVEIMYVCSGSITHRVGEREIPVRAGELLFLGRNTRHEILPAAKEDIGINFMVRPVFLHTAFRMMDEQNVLSDYIIACLTGDGASDEYLHFAVSDKKPIQNLIENLVMTLFEREELSEKVNEVTLGLIFLHLMRVTAQAKAGGTPRTLSLRALGYIGEHYTGATLRQFARDNGLPEYTASRMIKRELGMTFQQLLCDKRLSVAAQMLQTTKLAVEDVISLVGYENTSYFYRKFQEKYGVTPNTFRK